MLEQSIQIVGSLLVLGAFIGTQAQRLRADSWLYLLLNAVGSATLAVLALAGHQWGFLLLEGVWAVVSVAGLARGMITRAVPISGSSCGSAAAIDKTGDRPH